MSSSLVKILPHVCCSLSDPCTLPCFLIPLDPWFCPPALLLVHLLQLLQFILLYQLKPRYKTPIELSLGVQDGSFSTPPHDPDGFCSLSWQGWAMVWHRSHHEGSVLHDVVEDLVPQHVALLSSIPEITVVFSRSFLNTPASFSNVNAWRIFLDLLDFLLPSCLRITFCADVFIN